MVLVHLVNGNCLLLLPISANPKLPVSGEGYYVQYSTQQPASRLGTVCLRCIYIAHRRGVKPADSQGPRVQSSVVCVPPLLVSPLPAFCYG